MQELFDILAHKLGLINNKLTNLSNAQKDYLLDELLIEKKKEGLRILVETRLQQSLDSKRITNSQQLVHILEKTHKVMSLHDSDLQLPVKDDPIVSLVELYVEFFNRQNCTIRAQQISNIHKKKLCPRGLLAATLFNWLVQWTRKQFQQYLKTTIHSLYVDSRQLKNHKSIQKSQKYKQQIQQSSKFLVVKKQIGTLGDRSILSSSFRQKRNMFSLDLDEKKNEKTDKPEKVRLKSRSPSLPSQKDIKFDQMDTIEVEQNFPINKQIFYSAYAQELQNIYKNFQVCIPDLDLAFAKRLRKGGRRAQIKKRIKQVVNNLTKHMNHIKENIDNYYKYYCNTHGIVKKRTKKERRVTLDRLDNSENAIRTSQGIRATSTDKIIDERRKSIISSLSKKHRYDDQSNNSHSNLLPCTSAQKSVPKTHQEKQTKNKSLQLSLSNPRTQQTKFLILNSGYISAELQIIQQKAKKIKVKAPKHTKKMYQKQKNEKSISKNQQQTIDLAYSSLPVTISMTPSSHIRLPKIKRLK